MNAKALKRGVRVLAWMLAMAGGGLFLRTWLAPDACLDFGGSFNYERWECSGDINPYEEVRFYELKSFWLFLGVSLGASVLQWLRPHAIQQAVAADRPKAGTG